MNETVPERVPEEDLVWRRMHPVTPLVRSWGVIVVLLFLVGQQLTNDISEAGEVLDTVGPLLILAVFGGIVLLVLGFSALAWRMMRYAVGPESVHLRQGILFRQQRQARLDRLQAVDVVQPLLARLFGLAELRLEVAGGAGSGVRIGFLKVAEANALRNDLLARAAGIDIVEGQEAPEAPEHRVLEVQAGMLIGSLIRSGALIVFLLAMTGFIFLAVRVGSIAPLFSAIPIMFGLGAYLAQRFVREFNFTGATSPDGIRLRSGLLETRSQTIPPGRVQAIRLTQPLLWRSKDWWRVDLNVAGYTLGQDGPSTSTSVLLPVGQRNTALDAAWLVFPDLGVEDPLAVLHESLEGTGPGDRFVISPRSAFWLDPLSWRRNGYTVTERGLLIRSGRFTRRLVLVPHERTQSVGLEQGPLQRRLGLTSFALHSTMGPVAPRVRHLSSSDASLLLREQDDRARVARSGAGPEQWMSRISTPPPEDQP